MDELEFASKEDLEAIKTDPHLSKVYQSMQAGVTKKFQTWSEENKKLQQTVQTLTSQMRELDGNLTEWEDWYNQNKDALTKFAEGYQPTNSDREKGGKKGKEMEDADERYNKLMEAVNHAGRQIQSKVTHLERMLDYSMQLNDLYRRNPQLDGAKVLDVALKKGYTNLERAYTDEDAYGGEILDKKVEERLKPRLEEELAKRQTNVETGSGAVPLTFELPKEPPKSFADAGQQFLKERAEAANKPQP